MQDMASLGVRAPDVVTRVSEFIPEVKRVYVVSVVIALFFFFFFGMWWCVLFLCSTYCCHGVFVSRNMCRLWVRILCFLVCSFLTSFF